MSCAQSPKETGNPLLQNAYSTDAQLNYGHVAWAQDGQHEALAASSTHRAGYIVAFIAAVIVGGAKAGTRTVVVCTTLLVGAIVTSESIAVAVHVAFTSPILESMRNRHTPSTPIKRRDKKRGAYLFYLHYAHAVSGDIYCHSRTRWAQLIPPVCPVSELPRTAQYIIPARLALRAMPALSNSCASANVSLSPLSVCAF